LATPQYPKTIRYFTLKSKTKKPAGALKRLGPGREKIKARAKDLGFCTYYAKINLFMITINNQSNTFILK
jgi:hypothetical protein